MEQLNICIDIDGTITDAYYWIDLCNSYFKTSITEKDATQYYIHKILNVPLEEYNEFYEKYKYKLHSEQKLRKDVKSVITKLSQNNNIFFVTARERDLTILTYSYLRKKEIPYDSLFILGTHHKVPTARQLNCDLFIEDNYDNALELSKAGFKVLLIDTYYNRKPLNQNIIRFYNWDEVYGIVDRLFEKSEAI
ncbi:hypothetical protein BJV85_000524 [Clostridium acetobutylicum]|uniref:Nucleotidase CA_C3379 n=1 Tax=Clostridium acetobutylicum (strain ATCC 824 / DSM 792 / JCM 1419 / IAM 19013 / LMG 5710 / NBRC 13948 / NRRL B-527 / VKM B-1787 / 2291 / W) TaxID=272562 RepID=Y3379_CLOAB|nr:MULTISPECIES: hypothetical protein [Clostridium]Q97DU2.1 RecName: Full=Nucleotidase CA_C3379; AltName: Full=Sugar phosphatase [Clostridium acetobutylicum ATCC 824]AAK81310.1 Uncharacterized protein, YQFW B.subtilis homolog [Clostridium acetobutylicum ATCC 824]ADZ22419.1 Conserved hypothetical protein [Clostridium acetobutylicum EA 2018]AEI32810.1 hypothetical protein SMB_G3416 [Clostridium acetobutylicum DSM 1731]AWV81024.1 hypothetical protein DK921_13110 [Clostridium acetobutylicum]KHD36